MAYGITPDMRYLAKEKIKKTKDYLSKLLFTFEDKNIPAIYFVKNSYINTDRYIAEINHRVYSLNSYAIQNKLVPIFFTLTLPTQWHKKRRIVLKSGKVKFVRNDKYKPIINGVENNPKNASKELSRMFKRILTHRSYKQIPRSKRLYFRVTEPHIDGTPHIHVLFYVPEENREHIVKVLHRLYSDVQHKVITDIKNATAYMMKYILKTLDDLRNNENKLTDLTYWYVYWRICRIYTSRTLVPLEVYRRLNGKYTLLELTEMQNNGTLTMYIDTDTKKLCEIAVDVEDDEGYIIKEKVPIWFKKQVEIYQPYEKVPNKWTPKKVIKDELVPVYTPEGRFYFMGNVLIKPKTPYSRMFEPELIVKYKTYDVEDLNNSYAEFAVMHNEMVKRQLIDEDIIPLNEAVELDMIHIENEADEIF